jgi:diguanylate cyclase
MTSSSDFLQTQRGLLVTGVLIGCAAFLSLFAASGFDLAPLTTVRTLSTGGANSPLATVYHPIAICGLAVLGLTVFAASALCLDWLMPLIAGSVTRKRRAGLSGAQVESASKTLDNELVKVLELVRRHISTNESYAKSLANAQSRLGGLSEAEQVRVIVSLLVAENERMRRDSNELCGRLEDSRRQIEALRSSLSQAEEVVLKDPLTGVGNRRCFDMMMERAIQDCSEQRTSLSLVMCDIDHFKRVNDEFGHQVGDEIIKMFSRIIETSVREGDTVIRYGGEEFAIILPSTDQEGARNLAERVRRQFESKRMTIRETNQKIGQMTASFGVAGYRPGDDMETLVQRADAKLYDAKAGGRNRVEAFGKVD